VAMRASVHIASILLLVIATVAAAALLWILLAPQASHPARTPSRCALTVEAVEELVDRYQLRDGKSIAVGYALRAWIRPLGCYARVERAYIQDPDGATTALLLPIGRVKAAPGGVAAATLYPVESSGVPGGDHVLVVPLVEADAADDAVVHIRLDYPMPPAIAAVNETLEELNGTVLEGPGYNVYVAVTPYTVPGTYNVTVEVCPEPGWTMYYVRVTLLNATLQPPTYVGPYYSVTESTQYLPYTYPLCTIRSFYPILGSEQPLTLIVEALAER